MKIPTLFKKHTIQRKLFYSTITTVIVTVFICFISTTVYLNPYLRSIFAKDTQYAVESSSHQLTYYMDEVVTYSRDISFHPLIQEIYTTTQAKNTYQYFRLLFDVESYLDQYIILHDNLLFDIFLLDETGRPMEIRQKYGGITSTSIYSDLIKPEVKSGFSLPHQVMTNKDFNRFDVVAYICNINNAAYPNQFLGKIVVLIKYEELVKPLQKFGDEYSLYLLNQNAQMVYPYGENTSLPSADHSYQIEEALPDCGWKLVGVTLNRHIYEGVFRIFQIMFIIMLLCSSLALLATYATTKKLVQPLNVLMSAMKEVSAGNRQVQVTINSQDEIQEAAQTFNHMIKDINAYTDELLYRDKKEYEMTMQMLIYQINPHFVYNTLNCIICLARKKAYEEIIQLTKVFIMLLQVTLRTTPETMTTIKEEIAHTNLYVSVLQYSYENISSVIWDVDPSLMDFKIPRLLLYPLIENSIFHGILTVSRPCHITVAIKAQEHFYEVRVHDDGRGMSGDILYSLKEVLHEEISNEHHIGLINVNNRLKLLYGNSSALMINSQPDQGTTVVFHIPLHI